MPKKVTAAKKTAKTKKKTAKKATKAVKKTAKKTTKKTTKKTAAKKTTKKQVVIKLDRKVKKALMQDFGVHEKDTGSPEVQTAVLSKRIEILSDHLKNHKKDNNSRRGLLKMVGKRKNLLDYIKRHRGEEKYQTLIKKLGIRK